MLQAHSLPSAHDEAAVKARNTHEAAGGQEGESTCRGGPVRGAEDWSIGQRAAAAVAVGEELRPTTPGQELTEAGQGVIVQGVHASFRVSRA